MDSSRAHQNLLKVTEGLSSKNTVQNGCQPSIEIRRRWESSTRYFEVRVEMDLFGCRMLTAINGGRGNRLGKCEVLAVNTGIDEMIKDIEKRRTKRKYVEVKPVGLPAGRKRFQH